MIVSKRDNFYKIRLNGLNRWRDIRLSVNGENLPQLYKDNNISNNDMFFAKGKFFLFILLTKNKGLKILYRKDFKHRGVQDKNIADMEFRKKQLKNIIKIQKIFHSYGAAFDCEEHIFTVSIFDDETNIEEEFLAYITNTDTDINKDIEEKDLVKVSETIFNIMKKEKISRYTTQDRMKKENYVTTSNGDIKLVDIDTRHYFTNKKENR